MHKKFSTPDRTSNSIPLNHLFICMSFLSILTACSRSPSSESRKIYIVFRMDDYSALSNKNLELNIIEQFEKRGISFTLGVIPYICQGNQKDPSPQALIPLPPEKGDVLKKKIESGTIHVALHGFSHQTNTPLDPTEFSGIGYSEQVKRLEKGKELIEKQTGVRVESFVPPWNRYDQNTLLALEDAGFEILSAGWKGNVSDACGIRFLPATCDFSQISTAIEKAMLSSDAQPLITVLFHEYDFKETGDPRGSISIEDLGQLLDGLSSQDNLKLMSIGQANKEIGDLSAKRFSAFTHLQFWDRLLPVRFQTKKPVLQYFETKKICEIRFKVILL